MHKHMINVFLFISFNAFSAANLIDSAQEKRTNIQVPYKFLTSVSTPNVQDSASGLNKLLSSGCNAFDAQESAPSIKTLLMPILSSEKPPLLNTQQFSYLQSCACNIMARSYAREKNIPSELISLCNELTFSDINKCLIGVGGKELLPHYHIATVQRLCDLLANGHKTVFDNLYATDIEAKNDFLDLVLQTGHFLGNADAACLLAESAERSGNFTEAFALYNQLPEAYAAKRHLPITITKLLHTQATDIDALIPLFDETLGNFDLQTIVTEILDKKYAHGLAQQLCAHLLKASDSAEKPKAAFTISKLLRPIDQTRADVYLRLAIATGNLDARKEAYTLGCGETDKEKSIKHLTYAADAGHRGAQERCGIHYRKLGLNARKQHDADAFFTRSMLFFKAAAKQNSALARLKLAIMAPSADETIARLTLLAKDSKYPLQARAQYQLAKTHAMLADLCAKQPNKHKKHLATATDYAKSASNKNLWQAKLFYAACLSKQAIITANSKSRANLFSQAEIILRQQLQGSNNKIAALAGLGRLYGLKDDYINMHEYLIQAYRLDPHNEHILQAIASTLNRLHGKKEHAKTSGFVAELLEINPNCPTAHFYQGTIHLELGDVDNALVHFEHAGRLGFPTGHKNLGIILFNKAETKANYATALMHFKQYVDAVPHEQDGDLLYAMGQCSHYTDNFTEAHAYITAGADLVHPDCIRLLAHYEYKGYTGSPNIALAQKLYKLAGNTYHEISKDEKFGNLCLRMSYILECQKIVLLAQIPQSNISRAIFENLIPKLQLWVGDQMMDPTIRNEALYTIALHHYGSAKQYDCEIKRKESYLKELAQFKEIPDNGHIENLLVKAEIAAKLAIQNLLDMTIPAEKVLLDNICKEFEDLIISIKQQRPLSLMLTKAYNDYACYLICDPLRLESGLAFLKESAEGGSVEAMHHLSTYHNNNNNLEAAHFWLMTAAHALAPESPLITGLVHNLSSETV